MEISLNTDVGDWQKFQSYIEKELPQTTKSWTCNFFTSMILWAVTTLLMLSFFYNVSSIHWPTALTISLLFILIFALMKFNNIKLKNAFKPSDNGVFVGQHNIAFSDEGIESKGDGYICKREWRIVQKIERTHEMILIYIDTAYAYVLPVNKLDNPDTVFEFICEKYNKSLNQIGAENAPPG